MKGYFFAGILAAIVLFMASCSGKYDNAIAGYIVETEAAKDVTVKEVKELKKVTVGDSINYINQQAELALKAQIDVAEAQMGELQKNLVTLGTSAKVVTDAYAVQMTIVQQTIDSLKAVKPAPTMLYDGKKTDEVVAVVVEATYTVDEGAEAVKNFVLSPDGKKCYGQTDNPDMNPEK